MSGNFPILPLFKIFSLLKNTFISILFIYWPSINLNCPWAQLNPPCITFLAINTVCLMYSYVCLFSLHPKCVLLKTLVNIVPSALLTFSAQKLFASLNWNILSNPYPKEVKNSSWDVGGNEGFSEYNRPMDWKGDSTLSLILCSKLWLRWMWNGFDAITAVRRMERRTATISAL